MRVDVAIEAGKVNPMSLLRQSVARLGAFRGCRFRGLKTWRTVGRSVVEADAARRAAGIEAALNWIAASQDATPDDGSSACFVASNGTWRASYPETTGYLVVSLIEAAGSSCGGRARGADLLDRARRMTRWLIGLQRPDGAFSGGNLAAPGGANLFNTGQILSGLISFGLQADDDESLDAAVRAADWMCALQDAEGGWSEAIYDRDSRSYYMRAVWPLAQAARISTLSNRGIYAGAARRFAALVVERQADNGWIDKASFHTSSMSAEQNVLHTIAYTLEGLLETAVCLDDDQLLAHAVPPANRLLERFERDGVLWGEYDCSWRPTARYVCVTGCAQMSRVWGRLCEITGDLRYLNAVLKMNDFLRGAQHAWGSHAGYAGGLPGSIPIHGAYQPNRWPNWAAKFALDAFLVEARLLANLDASSKVPINRVEE